MNILKKYILFLFFCLYSSLAFASGPNFNDTTNQPLTNSISPNFSVNVGINSASPGQKLDVQGTIRTTNLTMSGQSPISGYVLTASDSAGDTTWSSAGGVSGWTVTNTNDVYETKSGNVGIGTTFTSTSALTVMSGNIGIGTWVPAAALDIAGNLQFSNAARTITTNNDGTNGYGLTIQPGAGVGASGLGGGITLTAGIGSPNATPGNGGAISITGGAPGNNAGTYANGGAVTIAGGSSNNGATTGAVTIQSGVNTSFASTGNVSIFTPSADAAGGNVSITAGSGLLTSGSIILTTTNSGITTHGTTQILGGNVGVGTSLPSGLLEVGTQKLDVLSGGNVGIASITPGQKLDVQGTVRATAFVGNGSALTNITGTQWTTTNTNDIYLPNNGNVGLGTTITSAGAALAVMNGNVGIGTWVPNAALNINLNNTDYTNTGGANSHINMINPNSGGQNVVSSVINGSIEGKWRTDNLGDLTWVSYATNNSRGQYFFVGGDYGTGSAKMVMTPSGVAVGNSVGAVTPANYFEVYNSANTTQTFVVASSGNVGIGSTVPGELLDVNGTVRIIGTNSLNLGSDNKALIQASAATTPDIKFLTNSAEIMRITNGGNVGIGTTTPVGGLAVMNGNVGIGTWAPTAALQVNNTIAYSSMTASNSSTADTINWNNGNLQKVTMTGNCVFAFTAPGSPSRLTLELVQDSSGSRTAAWPTTVKWPGGVAPTLTTTLTTGTDIVSCLYDGTNYRCTASLDSR